MASVHSAIRRLVKPFLFRILGKRGYKYAQFYGKMRDIKYRLVEEKEMALLPLFVQDGDTVIDIGANYAYYTDRLSKIVGKQGKVLAFEPIPFTYQVCNMIVKARKLDNVTLYNLGVSHTSEQVVFTIPTLGYGPISAGQAHMSGRENDKQEKEKYYNFAGEEQVTCHVVALDDFLPAMDVNPVTFVKIDIEGAEYFALQGMSKLIAKHQPVLLIEVQPYFLKGFNIDEHEFREWITGGMGYDIFFYDETLKKLKKLTTDFHDNNFVLIPRHKISLFNKIIYHETRMD